MTDTERLKKVIEWSGLSENAFSKVIGFATGQSLYNYTSGKKSVDSKLAMKISSVFSSINKSWLLFEEGDMMNVVRETAKADEPKINYDRRIDSLLEQNYSLTMSIEKLVAIVEKNADSINKLADTG